MKMLLNSMTTNFEGPNTKFGLRLVFILALTYTILITAWIGDDAQITFRQIWNFINGDGITFNFNERVQAFTHPLWFLVLSIISFVTRELFLTTIFTSTVLSLTAILILFKVEYDVNDRKLPLISPLYLLIFSWSYFDYATSGLENPLSNFLVCLIFLFITRINWQKNIYLIYTILALLVLNRLDYSILFLPLAILLMFETKSIKNFLVSISFGLLLLISWHLFATIYFGSPLANTFYAKMNSDFPLDQVVSSGWKYIVSLDTDFSTLIIILFGIVVSFFSKNKFLISISLGQILYMCYIISIGGDFMLGRFFTILVFISVGQIICSISLISTHYRKYWNWLLITSIILCVINGLVSDNFPFFSARDYKPSRAAYTFGDERGGNYRFGGLLSVGRDSWPELTKFPNEKPQEYLTLCSFLGAISNVNSTKYVIDLCALSDAFLARIPPIKHSRWVSGHFPRKLPLGYGDFLTGKINELPDSKLNDLLNDVQLAINGDFFTIERWQSIWRLNTNYYANIDFSEYTDMNYWIPRTNEIEEVVLANWDQELESDKLSPRLNENLRYFNGNLVIKSNVPKTAKGLWFYIDFSFSYDIYVNDKLTFENITQDGASCNGVVLSLPTNESINSVKFMATSLKSFAFFESHRIRYLRLLSNDDQIEATKNQNCVHTADFKPY